MLHLKILIHRQISGKNWYQAYLSGGWVDRIWERKEVRGAAGLRVESTVVA
jgi:hypothetical protein